MKKKRQKRSLPYMPQHESKSYDRPRYAFTRASRGGQFLCSGAAVDIHSENAPYYCLEGLDEKRSAWRAKGQAVASSAGQLVSKARLASGVKWTNGWPTHTTLAPQAIDATLVALIEPTGYSPG